MADPFDGALLVLAAAAAAMIAGYGLDLAGLPIHPAVLAAAAIVASVAAVPFTSPRISRQVSASVPSLLVVAAVLAYGFLAAAPGQLPVTNGPDVVHHLQLIHVISSTGRLPHGAAQYPFLLEMMNYTPGSHILAAAIATWFRRDALFVVYPIAVASAAVTSAVLYEIARRVLGSTPRAAMQACAAPVLASVPVYFFGSFVPFFFFAQVVSEAFAMGMLLSLVAWLTTSRGSYLWFAAACGAGVVLSWPVWIVPAAAAASVVALLGASAWRSRLIAIGIALGPAVVLGVLHQALHRGAASIVTSEGAVTAPSVAAFGLGFLIVSAAGLVPGVRERAARPVAAFLVATLVLAAALALLAVRAGSSSFYMPFKMMYLAILPAAVLGAVVLARASDALAAFLPALKGRSTAAGALSAILPLVVAAALARHVFPPPRLHRSLTASAREVGLVARARVPPACVDYFSSYWLTGYWLHLDVLGNPRLSGRMRQETFDFPDVAAKWIEGRGLPYAIVEDMQAIPREIRPDMELLHQSGPFVLVRNRRPAACPEAAR